jgi:uncharacterized membrane protein YhhN
MAYTKVTTLLVAFVIALGLDIVGILTDVTVLEIIGKCSLMPLLGALLIAFEKRLTPRLSPMLVALFFSWIGDILLLKDDGAVNAFFLAGMAAFFIAHITYVVAFVPLCTSVVRALVMLVLYAVIGVLMKVLLSQSLTLSLSLAIGVYIVAVEFMASAASGLNWLGLLGGALFAISDATLAAREFLHPSWFPSDNVVRVVVIVTYAAAQLLLVMAFHRRITLRKQINLYVNLEDVING